MGVSVLQAIRVEDDGDSGRLARLWKTFLADTARANSRKGVVTYHVVDKRAGQAPSSERRASSRQRMRLRSGKIVDQKHGFIIECVIRERSAEGARLRLAKNIRIPNRIGLFEDSSKRLRSAEIIWRSDNDIGVRFRRDWDTREVRKTDLASLAGQFYAVTD